MIETFIAGATLALLFGWAFKYGHIVLGLGLAIATLAYGAAWASGAAPPPSMNVIIVGGFVGLLSLVAVAY